MNKPIESLCSPRPRSPADRPRPRVSNRLVQERLGPPPGAPGAPGDVPPPPGTRHDGWTPDRQRVFLHALAQCGVVADAARAAGMSTQSAYAFRSRAAGRGFHLGWSAALLLARHRLQDELLSRALHGVVEVIVRNGEVWGERHRFDNRFALALLTRLDAQAQEGGQENRTIQYIAEEYDEYLDRLCSGQPGAVADFVESRTEADHFTTCEEARLCRRLDRFQAQGEGLDAQAEAQAAEADDCEEDDYDPFDEDGEESATPWQPSTSSTSPPANASRETDLTPVIPAKAGIQADFPPAQSPESSTQPHPARAEPVEAHAFSSTSTPPAAPPPASRRRPLPPPDQPPPLDTRHFLDILDDPHADPKARRRIIAGPRSSGW
jgi:hypothetical protein